MSKYTTEVRFICESVLGKMHEDDTGFLSVNEIIEQALPYVFNFSFPIYREEHRAELEKKILKHYYTREIGFETVGLWKLNLDRKLNEIMPYYNQLYASAEIEFNPMHDTDLWTTDDGENTRLATADTTSETDNTIERKDKRTIDSEGSLNRTTKDGLVGKDKRKDTSTHDGTDTGTAKDNYEDNITHKTEGTTSNKGKTTHKGTATGDTENLGKDVNRQSETPQGTLAGVEGNSYLTRAAIDDKSSKGTTKSTTKDNGTTESNGTSKEETAEKRGHLTDIEHSNKTHDKTVDSGTLDRTEDRNGTLKDTTTDSTLDNLTSDITNLTGAHVAQTDEHLIKDKRVSHVAGKRGGASYSQLLQEFRDTIINIDLMIINDLGDLFLNLW